MSHSDKNNHGHDELGHIVPLPLLYGVLFALMGLTVFTWFSAVSWDFGFLNIWLAMAIASTKATLVVMYFMHLRWDTGFNRALFVCSLFFVATFVLFALLDTREYRPQIDAGPAQWEFDELEKIRTKPVVPKASGN